MKNYFEKIVPRGVGCGPAGGEAPRFVPARRASLGAPRAAEFADELLDFDALGLEFGQPMGMAERS